MPKYFFAIIIGTLLVFGCASVCAQQTGNISGNLITELTGKKLDLRLNSNLVDGCILDVSILYESDYDGDISEKVVVNNGQFRKAYNLKRMNPGFIYVRVSFEFENIKTEQPRIVQNVYGPNGEKITGDKIKMFGNGAKYCSFETERAYPNSEAATKVRDKSFYSDLDEIIKRNKGAIIHIAPLNKKMGWSYVKVILSDDWYSLEQYEKERYVSSVSSEIEFIVRNVYEKSDIVSIHYYDQYGKELASPKLLGSGYKIKK